MNNRMKRLEVLLTFILAITGFFLCLNFDNVINLYYIFSKKIDVGTFSYLLTIPMFIYVSTLTILFVETAITIYSLFQNKVMITIQDTQSSVTVKMVMLAEVFILIAFIYAENNLNSNIEITKTQYKNLVETLEVNKEYRQVAKETFKNPKKIVYSKYIDFWKKLNKIKHNESIKKKNNATTIYSLFQNKVIATIRMVEVGIMVEVFILIAFIYAKNNLKSNNEKDFK